MYIHIYTYLYNLIDVLTKKSHPRPAPGVSASRYHILTYIGMYIRICIHTCINTIVHIHMCLIAYTYTYDTHVYTKMQPAPGVSTARHHGQYWREWPQRQPS